MQVLTQLATPLNYLRVTRRPKILVDIVFPAGIALIIVIAKFYDHSIINILGKGGLVELVSSALPNLTGFYIAALAAVASLSSPSMDQKLADSMHLPNGYIPSRRQFLCLLFGYLAFMSFCLLLAGLFNSFLLAVGRRSLNPLAFSVTEFLLLWVYLTGIFALYFTTLLGLYYLVDRAHFSDPRLTTDHQNGNQPSSSNSRNPERTAPAEFRRKRS